MINPHYAKIPPSYLFSEVAQRVRAFAEKNPQTHLLRLGIGDVTRPLTSSVISALQQAVEEQSHAEEFRGYGPEQGYEFLREAIAEKEYRALGVNITADEIFVSDGSKSDCANIAELFDTSVTVAVSDPVYPVYVDSNAMAGRLGDFVDGAWNRLTYLVCDESNGYTPQPPSERVDLVYLCSPNNPTGAVMTHQDLQKWVEWATENKSIILFDVAYRAFIQDPELPRSIYEILGAEKVAIEFGSFSKTAGFTGLRASWTVVPKALEADGASLNAMWMRRQATKFNGTAYIVQKAAAAVYTEEGMRETGENIALYMRNAQLLRTTLNEIGITAVGGENSPYVWFKCPQNRSSWEMFDLLLNTAHIVGTPGEGFGPAGKGHFRLSAFGNPEDTKLAASRLKEMEF